MVSARLSLLILLALCVSCNLINPDEKEPGYIVIPEYEFAALPGQGTSSEKITEIWVYANEQVIGVYDLPAHIPLLSDGATDLDFFAGIKNNGISSTRIRYPFYAPYSVNRTIPALGTDTIKPVFRYYEDALSIRQKDFESGNFMVPAGSNQGEFSVISGASVFEGERSGLGKLDAGESTLYFKDDENLQLSSGNTIFLELNYSCNNSFAVGLIATGAGGVSKNPAVIINPTTESLGTPVWNKIYIDLGLIPLQNPNASYFELYVEAVSESLNAGVELYLDNLKLVQWQ